jgi:hypothetical protein
MVACYIDSSFPALLHFAYKYADSPEKAILANANAGKYPSSFHECCEMSNPSPFIYGLLLYHRILQAVRTLREDLS